MATVPPSEPLTERAEDGDAAVQRLRQVQSVTDPALSALSLYELLDELLERLRTLLVADTSALLLYDPDARELVAHAAKGLEEEVERGVRVPLGKGLAGRAAAERAPVMLTDLTSDDVVNPILVEKGIRSLLAVPLLVGDVLLGVVHVGTLRPHRFDATDVELLRLAADRMAMSLDHARLFAAESGARAAAEEQAERLHRIQSITDVALGYFSLEEDLPRALLERVRELLTVDTAAILLLEPDGTRLVARAARGLEEEVERGVRIPVGGGFAGRIAAEGRPVFLPHVDHSTVLNPILLEKGIRSMLGVPLLVEGRVIGVLHVGTLTPREFTAEDTALLELAADRIAVAIDRGRQHNVAQTLQQRLLPAQLPEIPGLELAARYRPSADDAHVGGDWYDVIALPNGRVGIVMGDVVSHGVRAAAAMGQLRTAVRAYAHDGAEPASVLDRVNTLLRSGGDREMATIAYLTLDVASGAVEFSLAGHPPPLVLAEGAEPRFLDGGRSGPVGVPARRFEQAADALGPGETLLLYTDGLVERRDESLERSLERLVATAGDAPRAPEPLCEQLVAPLHATPDDVAVLAVRRALAPPERLELRVAADPGSLSGMRRSLRGWLAAAGADEDLVYDVLVAVGEAAANAVEHAYGPIDAAFDVSAEIDAGVLHMVVRDKGRWRPSRGSNRGRGLALMRELMDEVDVTLGESGTAVELWRRLRGEEEEEDA